MQMQFYDHANFLAANEEQLQAQVDGHMMTEEGNVPSRVQNERIISRHGNGTNC